MIMESGLDCSLILTAVVSQGAMCVIERAQWEAFSHYLVRRSCFACQLQGSENVECTGQKLAGDGYSGNVPAAAFAEGLEAGGKRGMLRAR